MYFCHQILDIEQEMNKIAIHTHVIFRPRNTMFSLSNMWNRV